MFRGGLRLLAIVGLGALGLVSSTGCGERARSDEPGGEVVPDQGGELRMILQAPGSLDPTYVDDVYEACIVNQIYEGLVEFDVDLNPLPAIAREWSVSRDRKVYVFTLRTDVRFHNGRAVTAEDFVYSFTRLFDPERGDEGGIGAAYLRKIEGAEAYARGEVDAISGLTAVDDRTLRIRLERVQPSFLSVLAMDQTKVVPREEIERWGDEYDRHPCGTGPFMIEPQEPRDANRTLHLVANPDYFRGRPYVDRVVFDVSSDFSADATAEALLAGAAMMGDVPGSQTRKLEADGRFRVVRRPELSFSFFGMNAEHEPLGDERVRRAIAHAIDRERIRSLDADSRAPAGGIVPPGMLGYAPEPAALSYSPEEARRLLAEAGYPGGEALPVIEHWQPDRGALGRQADLVLEENLAAVGIEVKFRYVDWDEFDRGLAEGSLPTFGLTWVADIPDPDSFLVSLFATDGGSNLFAYANPVVDSLLAAGSEMSASAERAEIYRRAEQLILRDAPAIPLYHLVNNFAVRRDVRGLFVTPFGVGNLSLERVWIDAQSS